MDSIGGVVPLRDHSLVLRADAVNTLQNTPSAEVVADGPEHDAVFGVDCDEAGDDRGECSSVVRRGNVGG